MATETASFGAPNVLKGKSIMSAPLLAAHSIPETIQLGDAKRPPSVTLAEIRVAPGAIPAYFPYQQQPMRRRSHDPLNQEVEYLPQQMMQMLIL